MEIRGPGSATYLIFCLGAEPSAQNAQQLSGEGASMSLRGLIVNENLIS